MSTSSHDTGMHCYSSTCTLFSGPSGYFVKVFERVIPFVVVKDVTLTDKDVSLFVLFFFPSALKQKVYGAMWARFILHTNSLYPLSSQTSTFNKWLNKWQCTWCFQYAAIDRDSNFVPLCCSCHLESWLETSQTTCSQFASHSQRTVFS